MSQQAASSARERATALLGRMTVEEKAQQVTGAMPMRLFGRHGLDDDQARAAIGLGIGHVGPLGMFGHKSPAQIAKAVNQVQRFLITETRLGIPALFHTEALNGVVAPGLTAFPTAIGLAAAWNPAGVEAMGEILRRQARAIGHLCVLSPVMDVARDARWGRVHETYGEDVYLVSTMSVAFTRGIQGEDPRTGVLATGKHFLGYGLTESGQNMARTNVGARELYEVYARPFEAAIKLAGLAGVMNSYSTVDGVPVGASHEILTTLLRVRLGFTGTVVSDYEAVGHLHRRLDVARDVEDAGRLALAAGLDVELPIPLGYGPTLARAVARGVVPVEQLDQAAWRVLRDKFALGLFDTPYLDEDPVVIQATADAGGDLARQLAQESITLLKNDGGVLPLSRDVRRIAIIGPHADDIVQGFPAYTYPGALQLVAARFEGASDGNIPGTENLTNEFTPGAIEMMIDELAGPLSMPIDDYLRANYGARSLAESVRAAAADARVTVVRGAGVLDTEADELPAALDAARDADVVILALGGLGGWLIPGTTEGEGGDTANIELPAGQVALAQAVTAVGTPCVAIVQTGRPLALSAVVDDLPALLHVAYGGQHASDALADVLFGAVNPGGKLPVTLPRHSGQVPIYSAQPTGTGYRRHAHDMHQGYLDLPSSPLFPFGHGLSYTTFDYDDLEVSPADVDTAGTVTIALSVRNTGGRDGDEVVQLYLSDQASGVSRPERELAGFLRITLAADASVRVTFTVAMSQLGYLGLDGRFVLEPGEIKVLVGSSADDIRLRGAFEVVGETIELEGRRSYLSTVTVRDATGTIAASR